MDVIQAEWGQPLNPDAFRDALVADQEGAIKAVILTHSETSTGVINDLQTIASHVKAHGTALTIVDCVTSIGAADVPVDRWGLDVVASGSQKGYMIPPGLSFVGLSERAWAACERSDLPKFYLDLKRYRQSAAKHSNPFTPAINLYVALETALTMMQDEGLEAIVHRHARPARGHPGWRGSSGSEPVCQPGAWQSSHHGGGTGWRCRTDPQAREGAL